jgi:hypothetical protein
MSISIREIRLGAAFAALTLVGCAQGPVCKELGKCGGDPVGKWAQKPLAEDPKYCQEMVNSPPLTEYLRNQPTPVARTRLPESTNLDWCYSLVLTPDEAGPIKGIHYWWENLPYVGGLVSYGEDGQFRIDFGREGRVSRYYSRTCLSQYAHEADCPKFAERLKMANMGAGEYHDFECRENTERGGCDCDFYIAEANALFGRFSVNGGTLTHFPASPIGDFSQASVCVNGDTMELSGLNNSYLWDRQGLRSLELVRINCEDGRQGPGELGVDCGPSCPMACPE